MTRERTLTRLDLTPATVSGLPGWLKASWRRADGSEGAALAHFRQRGGRFYLAELLVDNPTGALLRDVPLVRIETAANSDQLARDWIADSKPLETVAKRLRARKRFRLERPASRRLDDAFYVDVGVAYRSAVAAGMPPTKTIAEDTDTPASTVTRWIAEARERGQLPKAQKGKVSA